MTERDFDQFDLALREAAIRYNTQIVGEDLAGWFRSLERFPFPVVAEHLAAFDGVALRLDDLSALCEASAAQSQREIGSLDVLAVIREMDRCPHEFEFQPEHAGGHLAGYEVCARCGLSKPVLRRVGGPDGRAA